MSRNKFSQASILVTVLLGVMFLAYFPSVAEAGNPRAAIYSTDNNKMFWFIHVSDLHIGARGSRDSDNLTWLVGEARTAINPEFIVAAGDLTDATNGGWIPWGGPYDSEWIEYRQILLSHGINEQNYYDIPGNHDAYDDEFFDYYLGFSIQGLATGQTQVSWTRDLGFGEYHFLGVNTAGNNGLSWSISWPHGDEAGLDGSELEFIGDELGLHSDATLSMIFGHHPIRHKGTSSDTNMEYGANELINLMGFYGVSMYGYGHLHEFSEEFFTDSGIIEGVYYLDVSTLGKSNANNYNIIAIDNNGISIRNKSIGSWPAVVITTPVDVDLGVANNPYTYDVPNESDNPIRALVFDKNPVTSVEYSINGVDWWEMTRVPADHVNYPYLWEAIWDASGLPEGHYNIEVQALSSSGATDSDSISTNVIHPSGTNDPPVANNQSVTINEDTWVFVTLSGFDPDNGPLSLTYTVVAGPSNGSLSGDPPDLTYTPKPDFNGQDSFTYKAYDGTAYSSAAFVSITVNPVNDAPVASPDTYTTVEGTPLYVPASEGVLDNDIDLDGDSLTAVFVSGPSNGSLTLNSNGSFEYTPAPTFSGTVNFTYTASDGLLNSEAATVVITVTPVNIPPVAAPDTATTDEDTPVTTVNVLANDSDVDPDTTLSVLSNTNPSDGIVVNNGDGTFTYTPSANFNGTDSFAYTVSDGNGGTDTATVTITVNPVNDPPVAAPDTATTDEDTPVTTVNVLANDTDVDPDTLSVLYNTNPSDGIVVNNGDGTFTYTPNANFNGTDSFTYTVSDNNGGTDMATVTITVNPAETVTIISAVYKAKPKRLVVEATSDQPGAILTLTGGDSFNYGPMAFSPADGAYIFNSKVGTPPVSPVTVTSDLGGFATEPLNGGGGGDPPPGTELAIISAEYKVKSKRLQVKATGPPGAVLTLFETANPLNEYGTMKYSATEGLYVFQGKVSPMPVEVTVTSDTKYSEPEPVIPK